MNPWLALVAAGLATAGLVDTAKDLGLHRRLKSTFALSLSGVLVSLLLLGPSWDLRHVRPWAAAWAGAWGLSRLVHATTSALQALKDRNRVEVAAAVTRRQRVPR